MANHRDTAQCYGDVQKEGADGRALDAMVLMKAAQRLESILAGWDSIASGGGELESLADALRYNQRLWTIYQADLSSPNNPLSDSIRRNLLLLSDYVDRCTMQVLAAPDRNKVRTLIEINRHLAEGLSTGNSACDGRDAPRSGEDQRLELEI